MVLRLPNKRLKLAGASTGCLARVHRRRGKRALRLAPARGARCIDGSERRCPACATPAGRRV